MPHHPGEWKLPRHRLLRGRLRRGYSKVFPTFASMRTAGRVVGEEYRQGF